MPLRFAPLEKKLFSELVVQTVLSLLQADYREMDPARTAGTYAGGHADLSDFQHVRAMLQRCAVMDDDLRLRMDVPEIHGHLADRPERFGIDLPWMIEALLVPTWDYLPNDSPWQEGGRAGTGRFFPVQPRLNHLFRLLERLDYAQVDRDGFRWAEKMGPPLCGAGFLAAFTPDAIAAYDEVVRMAQTLPRAFQEEFRAEPRDLARKACWLVANHWYGNAWHQKGVLGEKRAIPMMHGNLFLGTDERVRRVAQYLRGDFPARQDVLTGAHMAANRR